VLPVSTRRAAIPPAGQRERELGDERARPEPAEAPPVALLRSLQQAAGNQAVGRALQRKVKIAPKTAWTKKDGALPAMPDRFKAKYQPYAVEKAEALARVWRDDEIEDGRAFASVEEFWRAVFHSVITEGTADTEEQPAPAWSRLAAAVKQEGKLTELPWASLEPKSARALVAELQHLPVQASSNPKSTAFHANAHQKLPKKVNVPDGKELRDLPPDQQVKLTPYVEILIPGHKNDPSEIERGIIDVWDKQVYLTAHYDKGSFVWLSGAPDALVNPWRMKAMEVRNATK
jgi:hypothetical protein